MASVANKKPAWITLTLALLANGLLLSFQASHRINTSFVRTALLDVLTPGEKLIDRMLHGTGSFWDRYFALIGVYDENLQLRAKVDELTMQLNRQHEELLEAERLRALLAMPDDGGLGRTVVARVIGRDPTQSRQSVTIDRGRTDGVLPDAAVITPDGIVGRVIFSGSHSAIVQLIIDSQSGVGVLFMPDRRLGIIRGNGSGELELDYIEDDNDLKEGEDLITSGQDRIYPKGLPVGVVSSVGPRRGLLKTARIRPKAAMGRLEELICIIDRPEVEAEPADHPAP